MNKVACLSYSCVNIVKYKSQNHLFSKEMTSTIPTLPQGWEERQDANGRTYYVNHVCK